MLDGGESFLTLGAQSLIIVYLSQARELYPTNHVRSLPRPSSSFQVRFLLPQTNGRPVRHRWRPHLTFMLLASNVTALLSP
jgi:hypothetical protein